MGPVIRRQRGPVMLGAGGVSPDSAEHPIDIEDLSEVCFAEIPSTNHKLSLIYPCNMQEIIRGYKSYTRSSVSDAYRRSWLNFHHKRRLIIFMATSPVGKSSIEILELV